jgi:butyrate kinase
MYKLLIINPGSTSTKIAVYEDERKVLEETVRHDPDMLMQYERVADQAPYRKELIQTFMDKNDIDLTEFSLIVGRGGPVKPIKSGVYEVNDAMIADMASGVYGEHASSLGGMLAREFAEGVGLKAYVVDPPVVDEFHELSRISGLKEVERTSSYHTLNHKAVARRHAKEQGAPYESLNLIVAHLGGGISVGAHEKGLVVDVNNALDGDGAFSPERCCGLPLRGFLALCYSGEYTMDELQRKVRRQGGLYSYLGTTNSKEVSERVKNGDQEAALIYEAMAYQVAKDIGQFATVLKGDVDGIVLTGGIAYDDLFVGWIKERVGFIAPVYVYPGEDELQALADGGLRALRGEAEVLQYE